METPWGPSQSSHEFCEGITFYQTAGHGGINLSPERVAEMRTKFPNFVTFGSNGSAWYEEDCDLFVVILAFPEYFAAMTVQRAYNFIRKMPGRYEQCRSAPYWQELKARYE